MTEEEPCYVYIIETNQGAYKIGIANSPEARYNTLLTGIPDPSRLVYSIWCAKRSHAFAVENILHTALEQYHSSGEWFKPPKEVIAILLFDLGNKFENIRSLILKYPALESLKYREYGIRPPITKTDKLLAEIKALQDAQLPEKRYAPRDLVIKRLKELGYDEDTLDQMRRDGDLFEPRPGFFKVP